MKYIGGPLDGQRITTRHDGIPMIRHSYPRGFAQEPQSIESYELRHGTYYHIGSAPYPTMEDKIICQLGAGNRHCILSLGHEGPCNSEADALLAALTEEAK